MKTLNCKGTLIDLSVPKVMGIINTTPDSFYDGGKTITIGTILDQAEQMLAAGAIFLDIGGYSSRPNAQDISVNEELDRVLPAIEQISKRFPKTLLSIDTFRSVVAEKAIKAGAALVNDISGGMLDPNMLNTIAKYQVPYILMHMRGTPQTMKTLTDYKNLIKEITFYFSERIAVARKEGINDIVIDLGFGFAKNVEQNFELLNNLDYFNIFDVPILTGLSRKSMIYKSLNITPSEALNGTTALNTVALQKGTSILRVHDVKEAMECISLYEQLKK